MALRTRAVETYEQGGGTFQAVAQRFQIGVRTLKSWVALKAQTGGLEPRKAGGGRPPAFGAAARESMSQAVKKQPDATLAELRESCGVACSLQTVCATLQRLKLPRKKRDTGRGARPR